MRVVLQRFRFRRTTLFIAGSCAVLAGIGLARLHIIFTGVAVLVLAGICGLFFRRKNAVSLVVVVALGLVLGLWRGAVMMNQIKPYQALSHKKVMLQAVATEDATYTTNTQIMFVASNVKVVSPYTQTLPGKIKVAGFGQNMIYRGDLVQVEGSLWPTRGGNLGQVTFAIITLKDHRVSPIDTLRRNFSAGMQNALPEPLASFGLGLLIGQRTTLPTDVNTQLAAVGLTHLIAVSGYNLTIIVDMVRRLTSKLSKYQSTLLAGVLIITFLLVTGFSASIVRAAIVSLLSIWAWYYGRTIRPLLLITLTAALTALWNPLYEWSDIGWYLSFLAFYGVLIIGPALTVKFCGNKKPKVIVATLLETFSAQLMTLPLIMFIFQQVSLISVLANLIVVPLVPIAMLLCLAAGISGMLVPAIAGWIAWPARLLLTYMLDAAGALSRVPHALVHYGLSTNGLIGVYITLSLLSLVLWHKVLVGHTRATRLDQFRFDEEARNKSY